MKKTFLALLLALFTLINCNAQINLHNKNAWKVIGSSFASVVLNASADALRDNGHKQWSHALEAASYIPLIAIPFELRNNGNSTWNNILVSVSAYAGTRVLAYDYTYNAVRGLPLNYMGTTSTWDKMFGDIGRSPAAPMFRTVGFIFLVSFSFNNL
jgi:hypothetical protein